MERRRPLKRRSEVVKPKRSGHKKPRLDGKSVRLRGRRSWRKSARGSVQRGPKKRSVGDEKRKNTRLERRLGRKKRSAGARSVRSVRRKTKSADEKIEKGLRKRGKRNASALRRSGKSMRRVERPALRKSERRMPSGSVVYKRSLTEIVVDAIAVAVDAAGPLTVTETAEGVTGVGEGAGQGQDRVTAVHLSSLRTSRWTMIWHFSSCCKRVNR